MGKAGLIAVAGGIISALMANLAFGASGGVLVAYFAPLPILVVGLAFGGNAAGLAAAAGIVVCMVIGSFSTAAAFTGLNALPSWLVVNQALRRVVTEEGKYGWTPIGRPLAMLACLIAFTLVAVSLVAASGSDLETAIRQHLGEVFAIGLPTLDAVAREELADTVAPLFLGFSGAIWLLMIALNAALAENLLARHDKALRPRPAWSTLALPDWFAWPLVIAAVVALVVDGNTAFIARNMVIVLAGAYFLQGLATVHSLLQGRPAKRPLLALVYLALAVFFIFAAPVLAGVGMADQWARLRVHVPRA